MTLADMSVITAEVKVDETDIVNIQIGQPADVTVDAIPGKVFKGHVTLVGDQALLRSTGVATSQSTTGTEEAKDFKVVVTLDTPSDDLRPGLSTTAKITTAQKANVLSLPIQALTMYAPPPPGKQGRQGRSGVDFDVQIRRCNPAAGCLCRRQRRTRQTASEVRSCHHGHHWRHGHRSALRIESEGQEVVTGPYKTLRVLKDGALLKRDTRETAHPCKLKFLGTAKFRQARKSEKRRDTGTVGPALEI